MKTPVACRLFGLEVLTHVEPPCVHRSTGPIDLEILPGAGGSSAVPPGTPALSVEMRHPDGSGQYEVWIRDSELVLRVPGIGVFSCTPGRLHYGRLPHVSAEALQWQVFGLVMSAWSEWAGRPVLHGATVEVGGSAVAFLGRSGAGKSSVTLEFLRNGHRVFGDDHLVIDRTDGTTYAQPALPWLKVGPDAASRAGLEYSRLPLIHTGAPKRCLGVGEGQWVDGPRPLGPLYLLERGWRRPEVSIEPVAPAQSLVALIQHTFVPRTVQAAGLVPRRLPLLVAAAEQAGVWQLRYPDGVEWLGRVREAVVRHAQALNLNGYPAPSRQ